MRLADVTVALRPRTPWEATDLGLAMTQAWWRAAYPPFLLVAAAIYVAVSLLLWSDPAWVPVVMWWLKPLFDRLLLYVYSQALFGVVPDTRRSLRALPGLLGDGLWRQLTYLRLDTIRSFRTPVMQLERLGGRAGGERLRVLARRGRSHAAGLTIACVHMEVLLVIGAVLLATVMVPSQLEVDVAGRLMAAGGAEAVAWNLLLMVGFVMVEPFYVAAGFALYLNRRTELEGWDIELRLRRIAERLTALAGAAAVVVLLAVPTPGARAAMADTPLADPPRPPAEAAAVAAEVLAHEDFDTTRSLTTWRWRSEAVADDPPPDLGRLGRWMVWLARAVEGLLWGLAAGAVIAALWYGRRWLPRPGPRAGGGEAPVAAVRAGAARGAAGLPADVPGAAMALWRDGEHRAALSLLYRGGVARLAGSEAPSLDSATEGEVLRTLRERVPADRHAWLSGVVGHWQALAYGGRRPRDDDFQALVAAWPAGGAEGP